MSIIVLGFFTPPRSIIYISIPCQFSFYEIILVLREAVHPPPPLA